MVGETGFEPATLWSQTRCATRLRYSPRSMWALAPWHGLWQPEMRGLDDLVGPEGFEPPT